MAKVLAWRTGTVDEFEPAGSDAGVDGYGGETHVSARAHALGLHSLDDLKLEVLRQRPSWWAGTAFHCPLCDHDFPSAQRAAEHVVLEQHPVLRMD